MAGWNGAWLMDKMKIRLCVSALPVTSTFSCINWKQLGVGGEREGKELKSCLKIQKRKGRGKERCRALLYIVCCPQESWLLRYKSYSSKAPGIKTWNKCQTFRHVPVTHVDLHALGNLVSQWSCAQVQTQAIGTGAFPFLEESFSVLPIFGLLFGL